MISFLRYWLPLLVWMVVIFSASADTQSTERTSRFLEPFLRWLNPDVSLYTIRVVRWFVRKSAHVLEFAFFAWLWWRVLRKPVRRDPRPWSWRTTGLALACAMLYAITDELHQYFVANRSASVLDVCFDTAGAMLALGVLWLLHKRTALNLK